MAKAPGSFDFLHDKWIAGVQDLCFEDERHYLRLLIYQWANGSIPTSKIVQMNVCGVRDVGEWDAIWGRIKHKFTPIDDPENENSIIWVQITMHEMRGPAIERWLKNKEISQKRRDAGRRGGKSSKASQANAQANQKQKRSNSNKEYGIRNKTNSKKKESILLPLVDGSELEHPIPSTVFEVLGSDVLESFQIWAAVRLSQHGLTLHPFQADEALQSILGIRPEARLPLLKMAIECGWKTLKNEKAESLVNQFNTEAEVF